MWMAEEPSAILKEAMALLAQGKAAEAEARVTTAARDVKAQHGSGSHPLASAYADIARLHLRMGEHQKAALEFQHASKGPMPPDTPSRRDRLSFMYGYAEALTRLNRLAEAEKVLRQCVTFAMSLYGPGSCEAAAANAPLAAVLLKAGKTDEALKLAQEAYDKLWEQGDPLITRVIPVRADALKAAGRGDAPFADLAEIPDELAARAIADVIAYAPSGEAIRMRTLLGELLRFADKQFGDGHPAVNDVLAAIVAHEQRLGEKGDAATRHSAVHRSAWSYLVRRIPGDLIADLEISFEPDGAVHLIPHLARAPSEQEAAEIEHTLTAAVEELYNRPG